MPSHASRVSILIGAVHCPQSKQFCYYHLQVLQQQLLMGIGGGISAAAGVMGEELEEDASLTSPEVCLHFCVFVYVCACAHVCVCVLV
jgi:hypothetical protein